MTLGDKRLDNFDLTWQIFIWKICFQLDNADEQAAQVRRELDGRLQVSEELARVRPGYREYAYMFSYIPIVSAAFCFF